MTMKVRGEAKWKWKLKGRGIRKGRGSTGRNGGEVESGEGQKGFNGDGGGEKDEGRLKPFAPPDELQRPSPRCIKFEQHVIKMCQFYNRKIMIMLRAACAVKSFLDITQSSAGNKETPDGSFLTKFTTRADRLTMKHDRLHLFTLIPYRRALRYLTWDLLWIVQVCVRTRASRSDLEMTQFDIQSL